MKLRQFLLGSVTVALCFGCASQAPGAGSDPGSNSYFELVGQRNDLMSRVWHPQSLTGVLPNQLYRLDGEAAAPLGAGAVVIGTVKSVDLVASYVQDDFAEGGPRSVETDPESDKVAWRALSMKITTERSLGKELPATVQIGLAVGPQYEQVAKDLQAMGKVVVVLSEPGGFAFDRSAYGVLSAGELLGDVVEDERVIFPALKHSAPNFMGEVSTLDDLMTAANESRRVVTASRVHTEQNDCSVLAYGFRASRSCS